MPDPLTKYVPFFKQAHKNYQILDPFGPLPFLGAMYSLLCFFNTSTTPFPSLHGSIPTVFLLTKPLYRKEFLALRLLGSYNTINHIQFYPKISKLPNIHLFSVIFHVLTLTILSWKTFTWNSSPSSIKPIQAHLIWYKYSSWKTWPLASIKT